MVDIDDLLVYLGTDEGRFEHFMYRDLIIEHAEKFKQNFAHLGADQLTRIPVFMDWNIGNFSVTKLLDCTLGGIMTGFALVVECWIFTFLHVWFPILGTGPCLLIT